MPDHHPCWIRISGCRGHRHSRPGGARRLRNKGLFLRRKRDRKLVGCLVAFLLLQCAVTTALGDTLTVVSLNLAHGRGTGVNQMLVPEASIRANLDRAAEVLMREEADIVALQEADGVSRWSGGFDHTAYLARLAGYAHSFRGSHAQSWLFDYGTAFLSKWPLSEPKSFRFNPTPPTPSKGFVLAELHWPGVGAVDLVSVHLDFSRKTVRQAQVDELSSVLAGRDNPVIVAGDFNEDWSDPDSALRRLALEAGLRAWRPLVSGLGTYKDGRYRLDWIMISDSLQFEEYRVATDEISDHRPVIAVVRYQPAGAK